MEPRQDHLQTISAAELLKGIPEEGVYIAAQGSYSPDPNKSEQYFLFVEEDDHITGLRSAWLTSAEANLLSQRKNIRVGFSNAMYLLRATLIWYHSHGFFKLFEKDILLFIMDEGGMTLIDKSGAPRIFQRAEIKGVRAYLDRGWVECGIKLVTEAEEILVVRDFNEIASVDITYDGFNLLADTWWAVELGMMLAKALDCPYLPDEDLA